MAFGQETSDSRIDRWLRPFEISHCFPKGNQMFARHSRKFRKTERVGKPTSSLSLERLESRHLMADVTATFVPGVGLQLDGDPNNDTAIEIRESSLGVYDVLGLGGTTINSLPSFSATGVQSVQFQGTDRAEEVNWFGRVGPLDRVYLDLGQGDDRLAVNHVHARILDIIAGDGNDNVFALDIHAAMMVLDMGGGDDQMTGQDMSANGDLRIDFGPGDDVGTLTSLSASRVDMHFTDGYDRADINTMTGNNIHIDLGVGQTDLNFLGLIGQAGGVLNIDGKLTSAINPPAWQYTVTSATPRFSYDLNEGNEITFGSLVGPAANVYSNLNVTLGAADDVVRIVKQAVFHDDVSLDLGLGSDTVIVGDLNPQSGPSDVRFLKNLSANMGGGTYDTVSLVGNIGRGSASQVNISQDSSSPVAHIYYKYARLYEIGGRVVQRAFSLWPGRTKTGTTGPVLEVDASLSRRKL